MHDLQVPDWRDLDREALGRAYNNAAHVPESEAIFADWTARSAKIRRERGMLDLRYGQRARNCIDFFLARPKAPTLVFVHGGYWQMRAKEIFAFVAEGPLARGMSVALVGYTLAPDATLDVMVGEVRAALDWLAAELPGLGGDSEQIWLSGWSAGAQLAAMNMAHPAVRGCLAISGIYDLAPMHHCWVNDKLHLDEETAAQLSPILQIRASEVPLIVAWGEAELPMMRRQSDDYATACAEAGIAVTACEVADRNHFSILEELASPLGIIATLLSEG